MGKPQFHYNKKTLRYERVGFSVWRWALNGLAYASFAFAFFLALNILQNLVIETSAERSLTAENKSLKQYRTILASQLSESELALSKLAAAEGQLHQRLFEAQQAQPAADSVSHSSAIVDEENLGQAIETVGEKLAHVQDRVQAARAAANRLQVSKGDFVSLINLPTLPPVAGLHAESLVSGRGIRINPFHKGNYHHDGIDIALPRGTDVLAAGNGKVSGISRSTLEAGYGNYIDIDHGNGYVTRYSHLESIAVNWGQTIRQGQVIGLSGSSGGSVAPHLHYEIIVNGKNADPIDYLLLGVTAAQHQQLVAKAKIQNQSLD